MGGFMIKKTKKSEDSVSKDIRFQTSNECGTKLFRNNVGAFQSKTGAWVRYGLANESKAMNSHVKSSDFIGFTPVVVTEQMVGSTVAVFTAIEAKEEGYKPSGAKQVAHYEAQKRFCDMAEGFGAIAGIADSGKRAVEIIEDWLTRYSK